MRQLRRLSSAVALCLLALMPLILVAPAAAAAELGSGGPAVTAANAGSAPMALASTGLDLTVPVVIGITALVLGIAILAWAFLRTGPRDQH